MQRHHFPVHLCVLLCTILILPTVAAAADTTPDPIAFQTVSNAEPGSTVTSNGQTITGIDTSVAISVSGGAYSVNGGPFTSVAARVVKGDVVRVNSIASTAFYASTSTKLKLGSPAVTYTFKVTTRKVDTVPDAFAFPARSEAALGSTQISEPATISGLEAAAAITVSNGAYSINGGEFTTAAGTVSNNAQVRARGVAGSGANQSKTVAVKIGGITGTFKITTVKTADTTPNAFSFAPTSNAMPGSVQTSAAIVVGGINSGAPISVTGGSYSVNGQAFTSAAGTVNNGDSVRVQQTASSSLSTTTTAVLKIGTVSGSYAVTTSAADTTPDAFSFPATFDAPLGSVQTSAAIRVGGINAAAPISIVGGFYSIDGGGYTDRAGNVVNGAAITVQVLAAYGFSETRTATLSIGGVSGQYSVTTLAFTADSTPDPFRFEPRIGVTAGSLQLSEPITVSGINVAVPISATGGRYRVNNGAFTSEPGAVASGDTVTAEVQAAASGDTTSAVSISIGGVTADFAVTTAAVVVADFEPDPFAFAATIDAAPGSSQISALAAISGINGAAAVSIAGGRYSINGGAFTAAMGSVNDGDSVAVEVIAADQFVTVTEAALTIGTTSAVYQVTTRAADRSPDAFAFAPIIDAPLGQSISSAQVTIAGIDVPVPITIVGGQYSINSGPYSEAAGEIRSGDLVRVVVVTATAEATTTTATLTVGDVSAVFNATTQRADTTPDAFSFAADRTVFPMLATVSEAVTVSGISAPVTASVTGGQYSVNGAPFLATPGPVSNGDRIRVLVTPGAMLGDRTTATLTVGGVSAEFTVRSDAPADDFPDWFEFRDVRAPLNSTAISDAITVLGINVPTPISVTGGTYRINNGPATSAPGQVRSGDVVVLQAAIGSSYNVFQSVVLTIGERSRAWAVRSEFMPDRLQSFTLVNASMYKGGLIVPGSVQLTEPVIIRNPTAPVAISVTNGSYSINGGAFTSQSGTVVRGDSVVVRFIAASSFATATTVSLQVGSVNSSLTVTTTVDPVASTPTTASGCVSHVYRDQAPVPLRLFVCYPTGWRASDRRSTLVHWFGGGFVTGDTNNSYGEARYWAREYGMVGIAPDYRVNDRFGTYAYVAADDGRAAIRWVQENAASLGIDPERVVVSGSSAGGGVAYFSALRDAPATGTPSDSPLFRVAAVVTRAGVPDTSDDSHAAPYTSGARFGIYNSIVSPSQHLDALFPPVIMFHGDRDETIASTPSISVCSRLIAMSRDCEFHNAPGLGHDISSGPDGLDDIHLRTQVFLTKLGLLPALR